MKDRFTAILSEALKDVAVDQRIILDTGDGAAISFLGDPEDALFVSMHMRDFLQRALVDADETTIANELGLRIGINLGPVKLIRDINGQPNIVGDGINVAQRIMSFAQPAQIVVSRSYYDVVSVISDEYAKLFQYEGSRTDKHVREHEIYIVGESAAAFDQAKAGMVDRAATTNTNLKADEVGVSTGTHGYPRLQDGTQPLDVLGAFLKDRKKLGILGSIMGVIAIALITALAMKNPSVKPEENANKPVDVAKVEAPKADAASTAPAVPAVVAATASTDAAKTADGAAPLPASGTAMATPVADAAAAKLAEDRKTAKADQAKAEIPKLPTGTVIFSIQPWGEVFVNGKSIGVSPPLKQTKLAPGKYKIDIKNSTFAPLSTNIEVKAKEDALIKYRFQ